jgi:hypothetical protein
MLWLHINQLSTLPDEITRLTELEVLNITKNPKITELPLAVTSLTNLKELWLHDNQLHTLPAAIARLTKLEILNISNNRLTRVPYVLGSLANFQELFMDDNPLEFDGMDVIAYQAWDEAEDKLTLLRRAWKLIVARMNFRARAVHAIKRWVGTDSAALAAAQKRLPAHLYNELLL